MMTATQVRQARAVLGWTQADLANAAGLPLEAVLVAEGSGPRIVPMATTVAIVNALRSAGVEAKLPNAVRFAVHDNPEGER